MKLTTRGRYAVTAMLDLALHDQAGPITLADIARRQDISLQYLEQLFARLRKRGLVRSSRGPGGGYQLAKPASDITVARVIYCVDESVDVTRCGGQQNCQGEQRCLTHDLWMELNQHVADFLNTVTLDAIIQRHMVRQVSERQENLASQVQAQ